MSNSTQPQHRSNAPVSFSEDQRKHLDFIQNIITRMNSNSFMIKGWVVTIVSALLALFASTKEESFLLITLLPIIIFWWLDTKYLQTERKFRSIYKKAIANPPAILAYELDIEEASIRNDSKNQFWETTKSYSIWPFYLFLFLLTGLCVFILPKKGGSAESLTKVTIQDTIKMRIIDSVNYNKIHSQQFLPVHPNDSMTNQAVHK
jgi:hypothetical protein